MYRYILFDLDGTLTDRRRAYKMRTICAAVF